MRPMLQYLSGELPTALAEAPESSAAPGEGGLGRRVFLKLGLAAGFALYAAPGGAQDASVGGSAPGAPEPLKPFQQPSAFVAIDADGIVTVTIGKIDFGQGVQTALPMLVAEEMDADWSKVRCELAPAGEAYKDPFFHIQMVGGSTSIKASWQQYREIGARMRAMLVAAAAKQLNTPAAQLRTESGSVVTPDGRRLGYGALAQAAFAEPVPASVALKDPSQFKLIGKPVNRLDARAKSSGRQDFGIDLQLPGQRTVVMVHPPVFGGRVARFDAAPALAVPGVEEVLQVPLSGGATGLAIVANGFWPARKARELVKVEWDLSGVERVDSAAQLAQFRALARQPGIAVQRADTAALTAKPAPALITAEFTFPYLAHTPMEPLNCTIDFRGDRCTVWVGSQFQTVDQAQVAGVLGLKPEQVTLHTMTAGGGFGRRATPTSDYVVEAAQVAKARHAAGKTGPVKMIWTREDDVRGGYYRPTHLHRVEIAHDRQGGVLAWKHVIVGQSITMGTPFADFMVKNGADATMTEGVAESAYPFPIALEVHHPKANVPVLWWRSVGHTHTAFVMETLVDELARAGKLDPVAYRRQLLAKHARHLAALDLAVAKSGYGKATLAKGRAWGVAVHESFNTVVAYVVEVSMKGGRPVLHRVTAGVHCNLAVNPRTIEAQVQGALVMGIGMTLPGAAITLKNGEVEQSNWHDYRVPIHVDAPPVDLHIVPSADPPTGMGECGVPPIAPAIANAVAALTGKRWRSLPFPA
ncbi:isoquinoline 1-oxidoreductase beta subunit [Mitsuaria sp. BK045]|uniref:xanthine dehydrogenase family protein molybdopterin-binding subunit n=1 Tax=unclassified Roseateles TaxID=2626991 RepID=UPI0016157925|nr:MULTISPECIES: xanthine dehydrogenase family protein molybdopterin-binding subunit [unclassified Roseateles]MBB3291904.1 isoquinoline 1-oxidoreductase beta subunit [Mitsuaria sp. BK041]MBB3361121.1 isoquinoline 1-oxidoreductase beta subunit [Mitsuaria sp. BK045]